MHTNEDLAERLNRVRDGAIRRLEQGWTKGALARSKHLASGPQLDDYTSPGSPDAVCWCLTGAVMASLEEEFPGHSEPPPLKQKYLIPQFFRPWRARMNILPLSFNDHPATTHEQVLASLAALDFAQEELSSA